MSRVISRFVDQRDKCKHGETLDVACDKCWNNRWCRKCHKKIPDGPAWWAPTAGPQCIECRRNVPTAAEALANLKKCVEDLQKLAAALDKADERKARKAKKPKFKMPQREE